MPANISAKKRVAASLQAIPRKGRSRPAFGGVESGEVIGSLWRETERPGNQRRGASLEPAATLEKDIGQYPGNDDDHQRHRIGPGLIDFRHVMEVHAPDRSE